MLTKTDKITINTALDMYMASVKRAKNQSNWSPLYEEANQKQQELITQAKATVAAEPTAEEPENKKK